MIGLRSHVAICVQVLLLGTSLFAWTASSAADLEQSMSFEIRAQSLESALLEFARQSKFQVLTASTDLSGHAIQGLHGRMSMRAALEAMLVGTGLSYRKIGTETISVSRAAPPANGGADSPLSQADAPTFQNQTINEDNTVKRSGLFSWFAALLTACGGLSGSQEACAQAVEAAGGGQLEEVVVTAEKRETNLQKTPVSINVVKGEQLAESSVTDLRDLQQLVPGLRVNATTGRGNELTIRGVSGISTGDLSSQPAVALLVDGVYSQTGGSYE